MPIIVKADGLTEDMDARFGFKNIDGQSLAELSEEDYNRQFEGSTTLVRMVDFFGWDDILQLKDGGLYITERNCGFDQYADRVDKETFLAKMKEYLDEVGAEYTELDVIDKMETAGY